MDEDSDSQRYLDTTFKEFYWKEHERKDKVVSNLSLPTGILIALITVVNFFAQNWPANIYHFNYYAFCFFYALLVLSLLFAIYHLIRVVYRYDYRYVPTTDTLMTYYKDWEKTFSEGNSPQSNPSLLAAKKLRELLIENYVECSEKNTNHNDRRVGFIYRTKVALIFATAFFILTSIAFAFLDKKDNTEYRRIVLEENTETMSGPISKPLKTPAVTPIAPAVAPVAPATLVGSSPSPAKPLARIIVEGAVPPKVKGR